MGITKKGLGYSDNAKELYQIALDNYNNNPNDEILYELFQRSIDYNRSIGIESY